MIAQKLRATADEIKAKIATGDYKIARMDRCVTYITIDGKFEISLWVANGYEQFKWNLPFTKESLFEGFNLFDTTDQKEKAWDIYCKKSVGLRKKALQEIINENTKELKKLKENG